MAKIVMAEYYEPRKVGFAPYGKLYYASGKVTSFNMQYAPKTFNAFCLKHEAFWAKQSEEYDVWEYTITDVPHNGKVTTDG